MTTLISLLGKSQLDSKSGYRPANYRLPDGSIHPSPYFGMALAKNTKADKLVLVGTSGSMWDVFFDHQGSDDEALLSLVDAVRDSKVTAEMLAIHREYLSQKLGMEVKCLIIPHARNQDEQVLVLTELAKVVKSGEKVVLDVTHGFRHLPMLALVAARYLAHVKKVTVQDVYYGALEMTDTNTGETPVLNLGGMLEMLDWVEALAAYENSGDYGVFAPLFTADGMPEQQARLLSKAAFFERTHNPENAKQSLTGAIKDVQGHSGTLGRLFSHHLSENVGWFRKGQRPEWELALADRYLERRDYLRAITYMFESYISHSVRQDGSNAVNEFECREKALGRIRESDNQQFRLLSNLRNAMAHGVRQRDKTIEKLLGDEDSLDKELKKLRKVLFKH